MSVGHVFVLLMVLDSGQLFASVTLLEYFPFMFAFLAQSSSEGGFSSGSFIFFVAVILCGVWWLLSRSRREREERKRKELEGEKAD